MSKPNSYSVVNSFTKVGFCLDWGTLYSGLAPKFGGIGLKTSARLYGDASLPACATLALNLPKSIILESIISEKTKLKEVEG